MRPPLLNDYFKPIDSLKGIGPKQLTLFSNLLKSSDALPRIIDLLFHMPTNIVSRPPKSSISLVRLDETVTIRGQIADHHFPPRGASFIQLTDQSGQLSLVFFSSNYAKWLLKRFPRGSKIAVSGRITSYRDNLQMVHPDYLVAESEQNSIPKLEPIYPLSAGITNKRLALTINNALADTPPSPEWQEPSFVKAQGWPSFHRALQLIHAPEQAPTEEGSLLYSPARNRLCYDEFLANQLAIALIRRHKHQSTTKRLRFNDDRQKQLFDLLPFPLTKGQLTAIGEITADLRSPQRMLRLLQGDVGSGKTLVALAAIVGAIDAGAQIALMAPTTILAEQHYKTIHPLATKMAITTALLTGSERSGRAKIIKELEQGKINLLIGTHALFQKHVNFRSLGLVVIDEQHRFGVEQRLALTAKSEANVLVMSATPIPRTMLLTAYGDMAISQLREKPPGRQKIETKTIPVTKVNRLIDGINTLLSQGQQCYWVCPRIDDEVDSGAANARFQELTKRVTMPMAMIHSKVPLKERQNAMREFSNGEIRLLVATTMIEVGVDVPHATVMVIEHAEKFGLSQLHQLRGRVGRGSTPSSCLLLYYPPLTTSATTRLQIMKQTNDGFIIAEQDLALRGAGDILGTKQAGYPDYRIANPTTKLNLLKAANDDAKLIIARDPFLSSSRGKALRLLLYLFRRDLAIGFAQSG